MFLHYILSRPEQELIHRFFMAQLRDPIDDDWCLTVQEDLRQLNITLSLKDIQACKKETFSKMVKESCEKKAFNDLLILKEKHSKGKEIVYGKLQIRNYLKSKNITTEKSKLLLKLRSRMAPLRENFRGMYQNNTDCPLCEEIGTPDSQQHLILCPKIKLQSKDKVNYSWLFGNNPDKMEKIANQYQDAFKQRDTILEKRENPTID